MKRVFGTAECEEVGNSIFLLQRYKKHENQMKGCVVELKINIWRMNVWTLWAYDTEKVNTAFNNLSIADAGIETTADHNQLRTKLQTQTHKNHALVYWLHTGLDQQQQQYFNDI